MELHCRWGRVIRKHVQGGLQLHLSSSSKPPDYAVAALTELFTADRRSERCDTWLDAPLNLTFGTRFGTVKKQRVWDSGHAGMCVPNDLAEHWRHMILVTCH